jgi:hypothetical protein
LYCSSVSSASISSGLEREIFASQPGNPEKENKCRYQSRSFFVEAALLLNEPSASGDLLSKDGWSFSSSLMATMVPDRGAKMSEAAFTDSTAPIWSDRQTCEHKAKKRESKKIGQDSD